jgi:hypothetical protein
LRFQLHNVLKLRITLWILFEPMLASPEEGQLQQAPADLAKKPYRPPIKGISIYFVVSTIERWRRLGRLRWLLGHGAVTVQPTPRVGVAVRLLAFWGHRQTTRSHRQGDK